MEPRQDGLLQRVHGDVGRGHGVVSGGGPASVRLNFLFSVNKCADRSIDRPTDQAGKATANEQANVNGIGQTNALTDQASGKSNTINYQSNGKWEWSNQCTDRPSKREKEPQTNSLRLYIVAQRAFFLVISVHRPTKQAREKVSAYEDEV